MLRQRLGDVQIARADVGFARRVVVEHRAQGACRRSACARSAAYCSARCTAVVTRAAIGRFDDDRQPGLEVEHLLLAADDRRRDEPASSGTATWNVPSNIDSPVGDSRHSCSLRPYRRDEIDRPECRACRASRRFGPGNGTGTPSPTSARGAPFSSSSSRSNGDAAGIAEEGNRLGAALLDLGDDRVERLRLAACSRSTCRSRPRRAARPARLCRSRAATRRTLPRSRSTRPPPAPVRDSSSRSRGSAARRARRGPARRPRTARSFSRPSWFVKPECAQNPRARRPSARPGSM